MTFTISTHSAFAKYEPSMEPATWLLYVAASETLQRFEELAKRSPRITSPDDRLTPIIHAVKEVARTKIVDPHLAKDAEELLQSLQTSPFKRLKIA